MEMEYVKDLDRVYLVPGGVEIDEDEYVLQMALRGRLPGVLPLTVFGKDGKKSLRADVTACASIASRFQHAPLSGSDLRKILSAVRDTAAKMPALLMSVRDLYLDPDCIFLSAGGDEVLLCYIPHISSIEADSVRLLSEFLLKKTDHSDQGAAALAYTLYDQVSADSYDLSDILSKLFAGAEPSAAGPGTYSAQAERHSTGSASGSDKSQRFSSGASSRSDAPQRFSSRSGSRSDEQQRFSSRAGSRSDAPQRFSSGAGHYAASSAYPAAGSEYDPGGFDYEGSSAAPVRKLPPPNRRKGAKSGRRAETKSGRRTGIRSGRKHTNKADEMSFRPGQKAAASRKTLIAAAIILSAACIAAFVFRMDLTQICGMGFLCASLIWLIHSSMEKHSNEMRNYWYDEAEDQSDDRFYQSLRKELYAEDAVDTPDERTRFLRAQSPFPSPALVSLQKDRCPDIALEQDHLILGKSRSQADIILPGDTISRKHARIERRTDGYYVTDLFSTNGTFLDGHRLESGQAVVLRDGAQLTFATLDYRVMIPAAET